MENKQERRNYKRELEEEKKRTTELEAKVNILMKVIEDLQKKQPYWYPWYCGSTVQFNTPNIDVTPQKVSPFMPDITPKIWCENINTLHDGHYISMNQAIAG